MQHCFLDTSLADTTYHLRRMAALRLVSVVFNVINRANAPPLMSKAQAFIYLGRLLRDQDK